MQSPHDLSIFVFVVLKAGFRVVNHLIAFFENAPAIRFYTARIALGRQTRWRWGHRITARRRFYLRVYFNHRRLGYFSFLWLVVLTLSGVVWDHPQSHSTPTFRLIEAPFSLFVFCKDTSKAAQVH